MNREALFADTTEYFVYPAEPDPGQTVRLYFRAGKDDGLTVKVLPADIQMTRISGPDGAADDEYSWFEAHIRIGGEPLHFYYEICQGDDACLYGRRGVLPADDPAAGGADAFTVIPGFHTPDWAKGALCYQILVDRFRNGNLDNDVREGEYIYIGKPCHSHTAWDELPGNEDYRDFFGGDLQGVLDKLDYLENLGVEAVYFNPLFASPSSHKYDTQDYDHIDPHFGSNELFAFLVSEMHRRGMRVIIDGVFNHCGSFHRWMDGPDGAFRTKDSPYRDYFTFEDNRDEAWPDNQSFVKWWGNKTLPKLNYKSQKLREEILGVGRRWVSAPFGADGWRLDVAADLGTNPEENHGFWKEFRRAVREANPDALIIAEHYGDPGAWLSGDEWDTVMNYDAFMEPVSWFFTGMDKHSDRAVPELKGNGEAFRDMLMRGAGAFTYPSMMTAMNELSNHDHSRFLTRTNGKCGRAKDLGTAAAADGTDKSVLRTAVVFQMTWPGMPTIYYGDEAGLAGFTDPDNRRTFPWGHEDEKLIALHRELAALRRRYTALRRGSTAVLGAGQGWLAFARFTRDEQIITAVGAPECGELTLTIPVGQTGARRDAVWNRVFVTDQHSFYTAGDSLPKDGTPHEPEEGAVYQTEGRITVTLPSGGGIILAAAKPA